MTDANASIHSDDPGDMEHSIPFRELLRDTSIQITDPDDFIATYDCGNCDFHHIDYLGVAGSVTAVAGTTKAFDKVAPIVDGADHFPIEPSSSLNGNIDIPPSQYLVTSKCLPVLSNLTHVFPLPLVACVHILVS